MNRIKRLINELHSYYLWNPTRILELDTPEYKAILNKHKHELKCFGKLISLHALINNGIPLEEAINASFTEVDLKEFLDEEATHSIDAVQHMERILTASTLAAPVNHMLRLGPGFQQACELVQSNDMSYVDFYNELQMFKFDEYKDKIGARLFLSEDKTCKEIFWQTVKEVRSQPAPIPVKTGVQSMDTIIEYIKPSMFAVIAAKTNVGKTALASFIAYHAAKNMKVCYLSLEMSEGQMLKRIISMGCNTTLKTIDHIIRYGSHEEGDVLNENTGLMEKASLSDQDISKVLEEESFQNLSIIYSKGDNCSIKISQHINAAIKGGAQLIIVDYIQNVKSEPGEKGAMMAVATLCGKLQSIAVTKGVTIIGCSQLNRQGIRDEKPSMFNLKDSSVIETSADVIFTMHRVPEPPPKSLQAENRLDSSKVDNNLSLQHMMITVEKNRHGQIGEVVEVGYLGAFGKFFDIEGNGLFQVRNCFSSTVGYHYSNDTEVSF